MRVVVLVLVVGACGRAGFGVYRPDGDVDAEPGGSDGGGGTVDGSTLDPIDAPPGSVVASFGEAPGATYQGVTADTYLNGESSGKGNNYGAGTSFTLEGTQKRALIRFDLSAIPSGTNIDAARLHLSLSYVESTCSLAIAPVLESWTEGTQAGAAGVANWTARTATQNWTTAGVGSPGSAGAQIASFQPPGLGLFGVDLPAATIQGWVDNPSTNFGLVLTSNGGSECRFDSSDSTTAANRPALVITYYP